MNQINNKRDLNKLFYFCKKHLGILKNSIPDISDAVITDTSNIIQTKIE